MIPPEPTIEIQGMVLSEGQSISTRMAVTSWLFELSHDPNSLGSDKNGRQLRANYIARLEEVLLLMIGGKR